MKSIDMKEKIAKQSGIKGIEKEDVFLNENDYGPLEEQIKVIQDMSKMAFIQQLNSGTVTKKMDGKTRIVAHPMIKSLSKKKRKQLISIITPMDANQFKRFKDEFIHKAKLEIVDQD